MISLKPKKYKEPKYDKQVFYIACVILLFMIFLSL